MKIHDLLGLDINSAQSTVESAYHAMRSEYADLRFASGSEGFEAAKKMDILDAAYSDYTESIEARSRQKDEPSLLRVDILIKDNKLDDAQRELEAIMLRNGEWHYLQALVYYKREWLLECRKNLVVAVSMEPDNAKYKETLTKLDNVIANSSFDPNNLGNQGNRTGSYNQTRNTMGECCTWLCIYECCLTCCRSGCR